MKFSLFAAAAVLGLASAEQAVVINSCNVPIYVQSFPYSGGKAGPLTTVQPGKSFKEDLRPSGSVCAFGSTLNERMLTTRSRLSRLPRPRPSTSLCSLATRSRTTPTMLTVSLHLELSHRLSTNNHARRVEHRVGQPVRRSPQHSEPRRRLPSVQLCSQRRRLLQHAFDEEGLRLPRARHPDGQHLQEVVTLMT